MEFPGETAIFAEQEQHLVGDALLVAPVIKQGATTKEIYFPQASSWVEYPSGVRFSGDGEKVTVAAPLEKVPVFQRAGTIVPRRMRVRRSSALMAEVGSARVYRDRFFPDSSMA